MSGQIEDSEVRVADSGDAEATLRPPPSALAADLECALARLERLQGTPDQPEAVADVSERTDRWLAEGKFPARARREWREVAAGRKKCAAWDEAWQKALEKFGQRGALLALIGPQGTGKTVMATGLASRHRLWGSVVYTTLRALSLRMEKALRREAEGESRWDIYRELTECGLLVIDECGKGTDTPAELLLIVEIIDARYREERRTVLVSNHGDDPWTREGALEVFSAWAGASLVDRLMESGGPIACDWPSLREAQQ